MSAKPEADRVIRRIVAAGVVLVISAILYQTWYKRLEED